MSLSGILLGIINIFIVAAVLLLVGAVVKWLLNWIFNMAVPTEIERLYIGIVALICLYMIVALLFGLPTWHIIGHASLAYSATV